MKLLKKLSLIVICSSFICLCGCTAQTANKPAGKISVLSLEIPTVYVDKEYMISYIDESELSAGNWQMNLLYAVDCGETVAYIFQHDVLTTSSRRFEVYLQYKETGTYKLVKTLSYEDQRVIFSAEAVENCLFFSSADENRAYIDKISLSDGEENCIYSEEKTNGRIPVISTDGEKLYWYSDEADKSVSINSYDIVGCHTETVRKNVLSVNPFDRVVCGAYAVDCDGMAVVFVGGNSIETNIKSDKFDLISTKESVVMWKSYESEYLYIGDTDSGEARELPCRGYMGAGFTENGFYICSNDYSGKNPYERIWIYNAEGRCVFESAEENESAAFACYSDRYDSVLRERDDEVVIYSFS